MKTSHRRYWVFLLLFLFNAIAYVDRVNMSVAGKPIAHEFGLSPIALGYLFSSFLWAYVLMMLPGGRLIDRWGTPVVASVATAVWSAAQMLTGWPAILPRCCWRGSALGSVRRRLPQSPITASARGRPIPSAARRSPRSRPGRASAWRSARRPSPG
jgi:MFS family permease